MTPSTCNSVLMSNKSSAVAEMVDHVTIDMGLKLGAVPVLGGAAGSPSNTKSPGLRPTSIPSRISVHPAVWPQRTWTKNWGLCPFRGGGARSPSISVTWAEAYLHIKWYPDASSHLATIDMGRKLGAVAHWDVACAEAYLHTK